MTRQQIIEGLVDEGVLRSERPATMYDVARMIADYHELLVREKTAEPGADTVAVAKPSDPVPSVAPGWIPTADRQPPDVAKYWGWHSAARRPVAMDGDYIGRNPSVYTHWSTGPLSAPPPSVTPVAVEIPDGDYLVEYDTGESRNVKTWRRLGGFWTDHRGNIPSANTTILSFWPYPKSLTGPGRKSAPPVKTEEEIAAERYVTKAEEAFGVSLGFGWRRVCFAIALRTAGLPDNDVAAVRLVVAEILSDYAAKLRAAHAEEVKRKAGEEREACAEVFDEAAGSYQNRHIAAAIRARGIK